MSKQYSDARQIVLADGRKLGFAEYGDPKGKPLFFFHGWPGSRLSGIETDHAAKKLHVRVISTDRPGIGLSDYKKNGTLLNWPDDVLELADQLKINRFSVVGVSGGGPYAAVCAYKIPHRLIRVGIVVGLAPPYIPGLLDGTSLLARLGWENYARVPLLKELSVLLHYFNAKYGPSLGLYRFMFGAKADRKVFSDIRVRESARRSYQESFRQGIKGILLDLKIYTTEWGFPLSKINVPVYLWYGAKDKNVSLEMGKYYQSQIPNSKLFIDPNGGHLFRNEHEEEIIKRLM